MLIVFLKRLFLLLGILALQVLVCNNIHLYGYATPMVGALFVIRMPLNIGRISGMMWAFMLGLFIDMFSNTPGETAASLTLTAFVAPPLLRAMAPKESLDDMVPDYRTMGIWNHIRYVVLLTLVQHLAFYALDRFSFFNIQQTLIALGSSLLLSLLFILSLESLSHGE
jgi:rod shape-determining protein MreD